MIEWLEQAYVPGPALSRPWTFGSLGVARALSDPRAGAPSAAAQHPQQGQDDEDDDDDEDDLHDVLPGG